MVYKDFARLVKAHREKLNISQQQLADSCNLTRATIMHIEAGNQKVFLEQALKIAGVLGISVEELQANYRVQGPVLGDL